MTHNATQAEYDRELSAYHDLRRPKATREQALRNVRKLAAELGIDGPPPHNG